MKYFVNLIFAFFALLSCKTDKSAKLESYIKRYFSYIENKNYEGAIAQIDKAIHLDNTISRLYVLRGRVNAILEKYSLAIKDYSKAQELDPSNVSAFFYKGVAYSLVDLDLQAIEEFNSALRRKTKNGIVFDITISESQSYKFHNDILTSEIRFNRGISLYNIKKDSLALADFEYCIQNKYEEAKSLFYAGVIQLTMGASSKGCLNLNKALAKGEYKAEMYLTKFCQTQ